MLPNTVSELLALSAPPKLKVEVMVVEPVIASAEPVAAVKSKLTKWEVVEAKMPFWAKIAVVVAAVFTP